MAAALTPTLINKDFQNWLKGALAVLFAKEGLIDLVGQENIDFQRHLLQTVYTQKGIQPGTTCSSCTTANVLACPTAEFCSKGRRCKAHDSRVPDKRPNIACPTGLCSHIREALKNEHRFNGPSWKNTDARKWCSDAFELSKCFMPPDGYSDKNCLTDTDFNGILAVVINNIRFQRKMSVNLGLEPNICKEARNIGRVIRHSANHLLSDHDLMKYIDDLITLLTDPAYLAADVKANDAVGKLKQLKTNTLTIHADDITNVLNESIKSTFDDQQKVLLHDIQEHFRKHENDSVEVIDRKIQEFVDKQLAEIKTQTDRGKGELNAEKEKGKTELKLQIKTGKDELQAQLEQGKGEVNSKVEKGKIELSDQTVQGKGKINSKVKKGKGELSTHTEQGKYELKSKVEKGKGELSTQTEQGKYELRSKVEKGKGELSTQTEQGKYELKSKVEKGKGELSTQTEQGKYELKSKVEKGKGELSTQTEQGKYELKSKVEKGKGELSAQTEQGKYELKSKVEKGKGELSTQTEQGKYELKSKVKKGKGELSTQTEQGKYELKSKVKKGKGELSAQTEQGKYELSSHIAKGKNEVEAKTKKGKGELITHTEQGKYELKSKVKKGKGELSAQTEQGKYELKSKVKKGKGELSTQTEQGKYELKSKVEKGKGELSTQTEQGKYELKSKVEKGKGELSTQTEQGKYELKSKVEKGKGELSTQTEQGKYELKSKVKKGKGELSAQTEQGKYELSSHIAKGKNEVEAKTNQGKGEIEALLEEISRSARNNDDSLLQDLKEDIITYYREHESAIPASPLVDEHNVPIEDLYVLPPLWAYENTYYEPSKNTRKGDEPSENDGQDKQKITISGLFLSGDVRYRKIYITANAGFGKTSLSQKLTMTWCQSHSPLTSLKKNYKGDELDAMRYFDFLFLLHLRDYQNKPQCNLDDLIMQMVLEKLSRNTQYDKEFVQKILHKKKCLIILDGLDEWAHPGHCTRKPEVPHNNHKDSCTVLTTTRDWKIGTVGLSPTDIDRRVELSMLDDETRNLLEKNAIGILNERNLNLARKKIADFDKKVKKVPIGDIIYIPYILLQLMCLLFGGLPIGKSKCEIYSNITEFTLKRGVNKKNLPDIHVQSNDNAAVPNCLKQNKKCNLYYKLIMTLGKLAFCALFSEKKESSLIFDRKYAKQFMTKQEIVFCLKVGLLCQTKDSSIIAVKRYHVFFQHKSVQEFFSAIYITSEWQNESVKLTILNVCSSLSDILEMSNVFVFVCGINPEVYTCIFGELQTIVDLDDVTRRYRTHVYIYIGFDPVYLDLMRPMISYQSMQVQCLQESVRNGNDNCSIHLHDYFLTNEDLTTLKTIINFNSCNVKSLQLSLLSLLFYPDKYTAFMQSLDPGMFTSLETLRVEYCDKEPIWLADILTESARTLKCLTLSGCNIPGISLSNISITALRGLTCLQSLYLCAVNMTHSNLKCLYAYISQTTTLTELKLVTIFSDHKGQYRDCDVTLDLHRLNELKMLHLVRVPFIELHVNTACLEKLLFSPWKKLTAGASATLWQDLRAAPVLSSLTLYKIPSWQEMIQTIPTLTQLQYLELGEIDMDDVIPLSPAMIHLERMVLSSVTMSSVAWREVFVSVGQLPRSITVKLSCITMTSQEWRELLLSVGQLQHPVTVKLSSCRGPSRQEWTTIVNVIKKTPTLSLLQDLSFPRDRAGKDDASLTLKNQ